MIAKTIPLSGVIFRREVTNPLDGRIEVKGIFMEAFSPFIKKRIARYLDAILFISALLLISSVLEIIRI